MGAVLFYSLTDAQFVYRQSTIQNYEEEGAATSRIELWKGALRLIQDYPLGTGGGGFSSLSPIYAAEVVDAYGKNRTAHNTYLLAASDWGIPGAIFFLGFLISTIRELRRLRKAAPSTAEQTRMYNESYAIELSLIGLMTAGLFTNRVYAEAVYWLPALASVLKNLYFNEKKEAPDRQHTLST
jgi:O-antigen ligase